MFNAMFGYCVHWPTFYSFIIPTMVPAISTVLWNRDIFPWPFAIGISILFICVIKIAKNFSKTFEESVRLRLRNEKLYQELSIERDQSIAANVAKSNFVASASHDLRQPMYAVNMYLDSLKIDAMPPSEQATVSKIKNSVVTLNEMFEALLNISKLDSLSFRSTNQPFEIERLAESLNAIVKPHALHKQLKLQFDIGSKYAVGDEALLSQMLLNLINNAIHYTDHGEVVVNFFSYGNCLHISVADTGCGISIDDQSRIFQEFFRVDKTRDHHDGLGLGLSIVSRLCKLIGAEISIDSKIDQGTIFTVSTKFPVSEQIDVLDENPHQKQKRNTASTSIFGKTIAVIEDDPVVLEAYSPESGIGRIVADKQSSLAETLPTKTVFTAHLASVLRTMALDGRGIAWLPKTLIADDLKHGLLVEAAPHNWCVEMHIRLYRDKATISKAAESFWNTNKP